MIASTGEGSLEWGDGFIDSQSRAAIEEAVVRLMKIRKRLQKLRRPGREELQRIAEEILCDVVNELEVLPCMPVR
jgi:hypothetical protein